MLNLLETVRGDDKKLHDKIKNEYGPCAFQKIYDVDILNEASGVSVDTIVLERQMTYIARRISPMVKGVYSREEGGAIKGQPVVAN